MKKVLLICLFICVAVVVSKIYAEKESVQKETNISDVKIQKGSQDYLDAYNLFLQANVSDVGENTYSKAIEALKKVSQTTEDLEEKLNCQFLISFSYFLNSNTDESYKTGLEVLSLAKTIFKDNSNISLLDNIKNRRLTEIAELTSLLNLGEEATGLVMDLYQLKIVEKEYQESVKKCWEKYKPEFDKEILFLANEYKIPAEKNEKIKKQLEEKYSKRGFFVPLDLEESFADIILNTF